MTQAASLFAHGPASARRGHLLLGPGDRMHPRAHRATRRPRVSVADSPDGAWAESPRVVMREVIASLPDRARRYVRVLRTLAAEPSAASRSRAAAPATSARHVSPQDR